MPSTCVAIHNYGIKDRSVRLSQGCKHGFRGVSPSSPYFPIILFVRGCETWIMHIIESSASFSAPSWRLANYVIWYFCHTAFGNRKSEVAMMQAVLYRSLPLYAACLPPSLNQDFLRKGFKPRPLRWCIVWGAKADDSYSPSSVVA